MRAWLCSVLLSGLCLLCGCTSLRAVSVKGLKRIHPGQNQAVVLRSQTGRRVRIGASAVYRFVRTDGHKTLWISGRDLATSKEGVHVAISVPFEQIVAVRIKGFDASTRVVLDRLLPFVTEQLKRGEVSIQFSHVDASTWLQQFLLELAKSYGRHWDLRGYRTYRQLQRSPIYHQGSEKYRELVDSSLRMYVHRLISHYLARTGGRGLGMWSIKLPGAGWMTLTGSEMWKSRSHGFRMFDTLPWQHIKYVQVENFSGGKTFGAIVGTAALAVLVAPLSLALRGLNFGTGSGGALRAAQGIEWMASTAVTSAGQADRRAQLRRLDKQNSSKASGKSKSTKKQDGSSVLGVKPGKVVTGKLYGFLRPNTIKTQRLFSGVARRRSLVRFVAALDSGADLLSRDSMVGRVFVGLRLNEIFVLGGGARFFAGNLFGNDLQQSGVDPQFLGFFRAGLHLDLDSYHRVAIPLSVDLGGGDVAQFYIRFNLGLRVRVWRSMYVGIYPFNPTYTSFRTGTPYPEGGLWSFPTTLEVGASF